MVVNEIFWITVHVLCILFLIFLKRLDDVAMTLNIVGVILHGILAVLYMKKGE